MGMEIVSLSPDEWPAYKALRLESIQNAPQAFGATYAEAAALPEALFRGRLEDSARGEKSWLRFARADGRLVGMIGAFRTEEPGVAKVVSVYVSPTARRCGTARLLMAAILDQLSQAGISRALLGVTAGQEAAIQLYKSFGFEIIAMHHQMMGDGLLHEGYDMQKYLDQ